MVLLFATNSVHVACFYRPNAKLFYTNWLDSRVSRDSRVILSNQKSVFTQLSTTWFVTSKVWTWVVRRATSLFKSFRSNVAKQGKSVWEWRMIIAVIDHCDDHSSLSSITAVQNELCHLFHIVRVFVARFTQPSLSSWCSTYIAPSTKHVKILLHR